MGNAREVSRKEFLELLPKFVIKNVRSLFQGRLSCSDNDGRETSGDDSAGIGAGMVHLDGDLCLAWGGGSCQACYLACPLRDKAVTMDDQRPVLNMSLCNGCGQCVRACRTVVDRPALKIFYKKETPGFAHPSVP